MEFTIKISIPQQPQTQHQQPREEDDCVSTFLSPSVGLPLLLFLADVDFEYFRHLGTSLWQFQFGMAAARRLMDSVVVQGVRGEAQQPTGRLYNDFVLRYFTRPGIRYNCVSECEEGVQRMKRSAKTLASAAIGLHTLRKIRFERPDIYDGGLRYLLIIQFGHAFVGSIFDVLIN